ncbi:unnamed protein product [Rotaria sp. Silwood2]|nr:unnamed protein product [Rotaria sp. Silwood2]CAF2983344.1 unnamed protein product [Rotaria sp. Silwood2]CAF3365725.1 unnamed protein product [Rotaria sp. Silwood2]CAF4319653.1 unnamed protein product [Rotaria sp. Silwood2]CAF4397464.1 unnamed protein product [Rotaria sp. Silwood2]
MFIHSTTTNVSSPTQKQKDNDNRPNSDSQWSDITKTTDIEVPWKANVFEMPVAMDPQYIIDNFREHREGGCGSILSTGDFQSIIKSELNLSPYIYLIQPMTSNDQALMYALCTQVCYQDEIDDLLEQHSIILADKLIDGYLLSSLNNFDLCFCVNNGEDELYAFVLTIIECEKYDKLI